MSKQRQQGYSVKNLLKNYFCWFYLFSYHKRSTIFVFSDSNRKKMNMELWNFFVVGMRRFFWPGSVLWMFVLRAGLGNNLFKFYIKSKYDMSVYKIVIWKDMPPPNKNISHMGAFFCALRPSDTILFA